MKAITKFLTGAAAAAALTVTAAAPAQAQSWDRRDRGIDAGDIITGVAVVGGIAAILGAFGRDGDRYGHSNRYRYRDGYQAAVNACAIEAERFGRGQVHITDVNRRGNDRYEVEGVIEGGGYGYGSYNRGYDRGYDRRYDRGYDRRYDRGYNQRVEFECEAYGNGRVRDFDIDRRY
jgi:hypothetical protein